MPEDVNKKPMLLTEGEVFINGVKVMDSVKCEIKFTPDVWQGRILGERTPSSRWKGYTITCSITKRRTTPFYQEIVEKYQKDGITPEMTIQGIMNDKGSDYYQKYGSCKVTAVGCVPTGDIPLISLDANGDVIEDPISFNAKNVIF